jgi:hypothetical protein
MSLRRPTLKRISAHPHDPKRNNCYRSITSLRRGKKSAVSTSKLIVGKNFQSKGMRRAIESI